MSTSSVLTDAEQKEVEAFTAFFRTFELATPVNAIQDLSDGSVLFQVLCLACVQVMNI
jgi:protein HOOK3